MFIIIIFSMDIIIIPHALASFLYGIRFEIKSLFHEKFSFVPFSVKLIGYATFILIPILIPR